MKMPYRDEIILNAKQLLMEAISECRRAISQRSMIESGIYEKKQSNAGDRYIIDTVKALHIILFDYGNATVRTDVNEYYENTYKKEVNKLDKKKEKDWYAKADESIKLFDFIMKSLDKYGILFSDKPFGFSNVTMESLPEDE